ncbi:hypothetical protein [Pseudomonas rhizoryzae]|uniref:PA0061/PA0062 family lipoprotein n=1 Tax=Pseudomonas rhizoryzae TaxID=2571129 RepID=UPI000736A349|nr:hypothetical protein [Pseudomonas rhizoryzae]KTT31833.1 lipoprotein [Pseudomonas psychrotolerans]KTT37150.1 lipoprotein [Pseudomonas psychrotolerans]KTT77367.1 lipoprotein [Pseudomonas psychrotolerans]
MRRLCLLLPVLFLSACSLWPLPKPDPAQAWIDLDSDGKAKLEALSADRKELEDKRYFQVWPGSHDLQVRYQFEVQPTNIGAQVADPLSRTCLVTLNYKQFAAGERYRLEAGQTGWRPWARLYDERNQEVAHSTASRCGDV